MGRLGIHFNSLRRLNCLHLDHMYFNTSSHLKYKLWTAKYVLEFEDGWDDDNDDDINLRPRDLPKGIGTC